MRRIVVDTNVCIHHPNFIDDLEDCEIILSIPVLEELDNIKGREGIGYKARKFFRYLKTNGIRKKLNTGKSFNAKNVIISTALDYDMNNLPDCLDKTYGDNKILMLTVFQEENKPSLMTNDFAMSIKAEAMGIESELYEKTDNKRLSELYKGYREIEVHDELIEDFYMKSQLPEHKLSDFIEEPNANEFFMCYSDYEPKRSFLCRYDKRRKLFVRLEHQNDKIYGLSAINAQQKMFMELLMNPDVPVVTVSGTAGTGKTIMAMAAGLEMALERDTYDRILLGKNIAPLDKYQYSGFLPGTLLEKLMPQFGNFVSNLEELHNSKTKNKKERITGAQFMIELIEQLKVIELLDVSSVLGSSFTNKFIIMDESQSFDLAAMRAIVSRIGKGTKLIIIGDLMQETMAKMDIDKAGLYACIEWFKDLETVGHICLENVERSKVVEEMLNIMDFKANE